MLLELAVGDAYGARFEYTSPEFVTHNNTLTRYLQNPQHQSILPGSYTDDTQMTLAIAELLISGQPWTQEAVAEKFVEVFHRDPRSGYAGGFFQLLTELRSGRELLDRISPWSEKSGAAMRVGPIGLLPDIDLLLNYAEIQARITHNTLLGIESAQAASLAVHYCSHNIGHLAGIGSWVDTVIRKHGGQGGWSTKWTGEVGSYGWMSVSAALTALSTASSLSELLKSCVAYVGDVDTVATIALAAGSCCAELVSDLPPELLSNLENGRYGRDYLISLDDRLCEAMR